MFGFIDETVNLVAMICPYSCYDHIGCWATSLKEGRLRNSKKYRDLSSTPRLAWQVFNRKFKPLTSVFVEDMGDLFAPTIPTEWIMSIIDKIVCQNMMTQFLFLTKNPARYKELHFPHYNCILGATIETNRDKGYRRYSRAPLPSARLLEMSLLNHPRKFVSIEPIMDFDLTGFVSELKAIKPQMVAVGYNNYPEKCFLPEPELQKTQALIDRLRPFTKVITKTLREGRWIDGSYHSE
jgi:hypothetical protein